MSNKFKKGDKIVCIRDGDGELEKGEIYTVKEAGGDFVHCKELEYGHFSFYFRKKIDIKPIKPLHELLLINARPEVNGKKINEIIDRVNKLSEIVETLYYK